MRGQEADREKGQASQGIPAFPTELISPCDLEPTSPLGDFLSTRPLSLAFAFSPLVPAEGEPQGRPGPPGPARRFRRRFRKWPLGGAAGRGVRAGAAARAPGPAQTPARSGAPGGAGDTGRREGAQAVGPKPHKETEVDALGYWQVGQGKVGRGEARERKPNPLSPQGFSFLFLFF